MLAIHKTADGLDVVKVTSDMPLTGKRFVALILEQGDSEKDLQNLCCRLVEPAPDLELMLKKSLSRSVVLIKPCIDPASLKRSLEENRHKLREAMNKSAVNSPKLSIDSFDDEFIVKDFELPSESFRRNLFRTDVIDQRAYPKRRNIVQKAFHSLKHKISVFFRDKVSSQN